jgi:hypothetical protein
LALQGQHQAIVHQQGTGPTNTNCTRRGTILTPQNENNEKRREIVHSQTNTLKCERQYAIAWDALKYKLVHCGSLN